MNEVLVNRLVGLRLPSKSVIRLTECPDMTIAVYRGRKTTQLSSIKFISLDPGWSGGAMVLGKLPVPVRLTIWITVGQGPTALAVGAGGGWFGHFYSQLSVLSSFSLSLGDGPI